jgi:PIN domain nuclease of toxin-antitoxin system
MNILLDTHAWLWMMLEPDRIGKKTRALIADDDNIFYLSIASAWEIAIKHSHGRLQLPEEPLAYLRSRTHDNGIKILPIQIDHACLAAQLPQHHGDPFDRLLIAQAQIERYVLLTDDKKIRAYKVSTKNPWQ